MGTDNKAVARFDLSGFDGFMEPQDQGEYVLFTDHERVVEELTKAHDQNRASWLDQRQEIDNLRAALAASRAEVEGLRGAMFAVYCVAANGGNLSRLHTEIERMRDAMEKSNG